MIKERTPRLSSLITVMPDSPDNLEANNLDDLLQSGYRFALALTHDPALAEDLVQEACLRVSRNGGPWQAGYLMTTIRNRLIDLHRRDHKVGFEALDAVELPAVEAPRQPADDDDLHQALGRLKRSERELLYLAIVESYTATEIAEITGRPRGTVLSTLHRSKQKLRDLLTRGEKGIVS